MNQIKLVIFDLDDTLCDTSGPNDSTSRSIENITLYPSVEGLIKHLHSRGISSAIVSTGDSVTQEKKIEKFGLRKFVDAVYITDLPENKHAFFTRCLQEFNAGPDQTLVVGDRMDREIYIGKTLRCVTMRVLQGRHQHMQPVHENQIADFTIPNIAALQGWFEP